MQNLQDPARRVPDPSQSSQPNPPVPPPVPPVNNPQPQPAPNPVYQQPLQQTVYQQPQQPYQQSYQQPINQQYQYRQQQNYRQNNTEKLYPPVKMGEWMWTMFVAFIPIVGFILLLVWAFSSTTNPSKASWAKATLLWGVIITIIYVIIYVIAILIAGVSYGFLNS